MKIFNTSLSDIARSNYLFLSLRFHEIANYLEENKNLLQNRVGDYFDIVSGYAFKSDDYDSEGIKLIRIGDITKDGEIILEETVRLPEDFEEKFKKYLLQQNDILIAMTGATIGKTGFLGILSEKLFLNQRVGALRIKSKNINAKFFYYLTKGNLFQKQIKINAMGKSQDNVSPFDILDIKIPYVRKTIQDETIEKIKPIEREIENLQAQIGAPTEPINRVFAREFGFDIEKFEELKKKKVFEVSLSSFAISNLLRMTTVFNNPANSFLRDFLRSREDFVDLKSILTRKIQRGKQPIYTEDGILVIKTKNIQKGNLDLSEPEFVSEEFYKLGSERAGIENLDLLLTSTGMGRGKFALYNYEEIAIADSHISIIRFDKEKVNPDFLNFYSQSILGIGQLKYLEVQIKGTPEIYEEQLKTFKVPVVDKDTQEKIIAEIQIEISDQNEIKRKVEEKRKEIDRIIEEVLK